MTEALRIDGYACTAGRRTLFSGLSFALDDGAWAMLTGPNGSGKTTLLRAIAGLGTPADGRLLWRGQPCRRDAPAWHAIRLYQGHGAGWKEALSARENLALQAGLDGTPQTGAALDAALARVGLGRQAGLAFGRLSAGQRRRLSLARLALQAGAGAGRFALWLLDEPTTALDADAQRTFAELLGSHLQRGGSAIVATHLPIGTVAAPLPLALGATTVA